MNNQSTRSFMVAAQRELAIASEHKAYFGRQVRVLMDTTSHIESMRYWLKTAGDIKLLKARKAHLLASATEVMAEGRAAAHQSIDYVTLRTANNIRHAISWYETALLCSTFSQWDEVVAEFERHACDALVMLDVSLISTKVKWTSAKKAAVRMRRVIDKASKVLLPAVATPKYIRKVRGGVYSYIWYQEPAFRITFKQWCQALVINSISKNWFVGSI